MDKKIDLRIKQLILMGLGPTLLKALYKYIGTNTSELKKELEELLLSLDYQEDMLADDIIYFARWGIEECFKMNLNIDFIFDEEELQKMSYAWFFILPRDEYKNFGSESNFRNDNFIKDYVSVAISYITKTYSDKLEEKFGFSKSMDITTQLAKMASGCSEKEYPRIQAKIDEEILSLLSGKKKFNQKNEIKRMKSKRSGCNWYK